MPGLTLVTCLFDLARRERARDSRSVAEYLETAETLALAVDHDLVAFADTELAPRIEAARRDLGLASRTRVIAVSLEELRSYSRLGSIAKARAEHPLRNGTPAKDTPLYAVLGWAKAELLARTVAEDPFSASHIAWIDLGLRWGPYPGEDPFEHPADRIRLLMMRPFLPVELAEHDRYLSWNWGHVAGGYISGSLANIEWLSARFEELAGELLAASFAASDEQLLPLLATKDPERFEFHHGDYDHVLANYLKLHGSAPNLAFQLRVWRSGGTPGAGAALARAVVDSLESGEFEAEPDALATLLDECYLAAFYGEDEPRALARRIASIYMERVESDPAFRDAFLRDEIRVRKNLALVMSFP
jgi:Bacterial protein of unknown function (HtrL_YibB)